MSQQPIKIEKIHRLIGLIAVLGGREETAKRLFCSPDTLGRILSGCRTNAATRAAVDRLLAEYSQEQTAA